MKLTCDVPQYLYKKKNILSSVFLLFWGLKDPEQFHINNLKRTKSSNISATFIFPTFKTARCPMPPTDFLFGPFKTNYFDRSPFNGYPKILANFVFAETKLIINYSAVLMNCFLNLCRVYCWIDCNLNIYLIFSLRLVDLRFNGHKSGRSWV